ncbi:leukotriene B4 receptor 1 [Trichomycterus rosablanca]|uniref:leukotriene B4 receptor 1 n=1 Tax=Trichomycterus rosablanca TaxID=2290929 RepID=UPI002F35D5C8
MNYSGGDFDQPSAQELEGELGLVGACVILALCFVVGAPGNMLVVWTILRHVKPRSYTVILILHLAVADLLVVVTLPIWIYSLANYWVFGDVACKAIVYIIYVCMYASIFLITIMSVERFLAVRYPFASAAWRKKQMLNKILVVVWVASFLFSVPVIITQALDGETGEEQCLYRVYKSDMQEAVILLLESLVGFLIPFSMLVICYGCLFSRILQMNLRSKSKSTMLIASVVILFALCWIPHHIGNLLSLVGLALEHGSQAEKNLNEVLDNMRLITSSLVFMSSTVNPVLYVFAARSFRSSLKDTGIHKLFRHLSSTAAGDGSKDLSFVSRRQNSHTNTSQCCTESKAQIDLLVNICNNAITDETV